MGCLPLLAATLGYECRCTGRAVLVTVDHCDGPHGEWCLEETGTAHGHEHDGEGSPAGEDTEHHTLVQSDTDGLAPTVQTAPAVTPTLLAVLPGHEVWSSRPSRVLVARGGLSAGRPPPLVGVARTVVLLI